MRIKLSSVFVGDQEKALKFYTEVLGFVKKRNCRPGTSRWLTVVAEGRDDLELLLEPNANPPARSTRKRSKQQESHPLCSLLATSKREHKRMVELGVCFKIKPTQSGAVKIAVFDDTCGNLVQPLEN